MNDTYSGTVGVRQIGEGKWLAQIYRDGFNTVLGSTYQTKREAVAARKAAEKMYDMMKRGAH